TWTELGYVKTQIGRPIRLFTHCQIGLRKYSPTSGYGETLLIGRKPCTDAFSELAPDVRGKSTAFRISHRCGLDALVDLYRPCLRSRVVRFGRTPRGSSESACHLT